MVTKIKQIQNRKGFISFRLNVSWKLTLPAGFQPGGVFRLENRASVYFDTAMYKILKRSIDPSARRAKIEISPPQREQ